MRIFSREIRINMGKKEQRRLFVLRTSFRSRGVESPQQIAILADYTIIISVVLCRIFKLLESYQIIWLSLWRRTPLLFWGSFFHFCSRYLPTR